MSFRFWIVSTLLGELIGALFPRLRAKLGVWDRKHRERPVWKQVGLAVLGGMLSVPIVEWFRRDQHEWFMEQVAGERTHRVHTEFFIVPLVRLPELHQAAPGRLFRKDRYVELLGSFRHPTAHHEADEFYTGNLIAYLTEARVIEEPDEPSHLVNDIHEFRGGAWDVINGGQRTADALDPERFDPAVLRRFFEDTTSEAHPDAGAEMLRALRVLREVVASADEGSVVLVTYR